MSSLSFHAQYRPDIDGLRAIAILPVVLYHAGLPGLSGGFVGVDVFFVISGFLIAGMVDREVREGKFSLVQFYERRARRILPALVSVLTVCLVAGWILAFPNDFVDLAKSALATLGFSSNVYFWIVTDYFAPAAELQPLLHTWSVGVEEQFYLVFPLTMMLAASWRRRTLLFLLAAVLLASLGIGLWATFTYPEFAFYLIPSRAWELAIGVLLALGAVPGVESRYLREFSAFAGLALVLGAVAFLGPETPFPGFAAILPCVGTALIIHAGSAGSSIVGRVLSSPPLRFIGLVSYSLYLWHWPILAFARMAAGSIELPVSWRVAAVLASLLSASASWKWIEQPFRDRQRVSRRLIFVGSAGSLALVGSLAAIVVFTGGFEGRFSERDYESVGLTRVEEAARAEAKDCDGRRPEDGLCRTGSGTDSAAVLLWGDSHAGTAWLGLKKAAMASGRSAGLATFSACPPALGIVRIRGQWAGCVEPNAETLDHVLSGRANYSTVILHARWPMYATGRRSEEEDGTSIHLGFEGPNPRPSPDPDIVLERGLDSLVQVLGAAGRRVILLGDVPEVGFGVHAAAMRHFRSGAEFPEPRRVENTRSRHALSDSIMTAIAERRGAEFYSITSDFCSPECVYRVDEGLVYQDNNHLTAVGSEFLLAPILESILNGERIPTAGSRRPNGVRRQDDLAFENAGDSR